MYRCVFLDVFWGIMLFASVIVKIWTGLCGSIIASYNKEIVEAISESLCIYVGRYLDRNRQVVSTLEL